MPENRNEAEVQAALEMQRQASVEKAKAIENKELQPYDPLIQYRRDFSPEVVYLENGKPVIDDLDLHEIMQFYRSSVKEGSLLNLGAGTTHTQYMMAVEDKLTHITALDISPQNLQVTRELNESFSNDSVSREYINDTDVNISRIYAGAIASDSRYGADRTEEGIIRGVVEKSKRPDGSLDLVVGDMYDLDASLGDRKFDNILLSYSIFVHKDAKEIYQLFEGVKKHLNENGKIIVADFTGFDEDDLNEDFPESPEVKKDFVAPDITASLVRDALVKSKFSDVNVREQDIQVVDGVESGKGYKYLFADAVSK